MRLIISLDKLCNIARDNFGLKKMGFNYVSLDARGYRTGALNEVLDIKNTKILLSYHWT